MPVVERRVPVIADERVEPGFGTGALKITPGHDPIDFEIGRDHGLPTLTVIGPDGRMIDERLRGARRRRRPTSAILAWLKEHGQLEKREHYRHSVGTCERCHTRIEPLVSPQWWCAMDELARPAIEALEARRVRYHPESQHRFAIDSLENAPDWCVSRQLWWGHQIPIWTCPDGHVAVRVARARRRAPSAARRSCERDPDVLDTWFSSALWPFATLGWPEADPRARALLPGRRQRDRARDHPPLGEPHDLRRARADGRDPVHRRDHHLDRARARRAADVEEPRHRASTRSRRSTQHGADATRYGLLKISSTQDVRFSWGAIEEGRKLANKLWNASRLLLSNAEGVEPELRPRDARGALDPRPARRGAGARSRTRSARSSSSAPWTRSTTSTFDDFCDWYLGGDQAAAATTATRTRARPRSPRSSGCWSSCTRSCRT